MLPYGYALYETGRVLDDLAIMRGALRAGDRARRTGPRARTRSACDRSEILADPAVDLDEARAIAEEAIETFTELGDEAGLARPSGDSA